MVRKVWAAIAPTWHLYRFLMRLVWEVWTAFAPAWNRDRFLMRLVWEVWTAFAPTWKPLHARIKLHFMTHKKVNI